MKAIHLLAAVLLGALAASALPVLPRTADGAELYLDPLDPAAVLPLCGVEGEFLPDGVRDVGYGKVYRFRQTDRGREVFGGEVCLSTDRNGKILSVNDRSEPLGKVLEGALDGEAAAETFRSLYGGEVRSVEETIVPQGNASERAWAISSGEETVYLSAVSGQPLLTLPLSPSAEARTQTDAFGNEVSVPLEYVEGMGYYLGDDARNIRTYTARNSYSSISSPYVSEDGVFTDALAVSAYYNVIKAYDFYTDGDNIGAPLFGIDGTDGQPGEIPIRIVMHYGTEYENAAYTYDALRHTAYLYIGDGREDGSIYEPARSADVIAHEYQHGVTEFAAGLNYLNESGALNEAISDIFGALVEGFDPSDERFWLIGETAVPEGQSGLRSLRDPHIEYSGYRVSTLEMAPLCFNTSRFHDHSTCDNGNVHSNSTIVSHVQYKIWQEMPDYFTRERIGQLWYATLCALSPNADFEEFAEQFALAAEHLDFTQAAQDCIRRALVGSGLVEDDALHAVIFLNYDGTILKEDLVEDGADATPPPDPSRPDLARYSFVFSGWNRSFENVTEDLILTARFERTDRLFEVVFTDADGQPVKTERVVYGGSAVPPDPPEHPYVREYDYEFTGWEGDYDNVTEDVTVTPAYREFRCFTVDFLSGEEQVASVRVREGDAVTPPEGAEMASTAQYDFAFAGWDTPTDCVTEDMTVRAIFDRALRSYTVTYRDKSGQREETLFYGETPDLPALDDERFTGWYLDEACTRPAEDVAVTGDMELFAGYRDESSVLLPVLLGVGGALLLGGVAAFLLLRKRR